MYDDKMYTETERSVTESHVYLHIYERSVIALQAEAVMDYMLACGEPAISHDSHHVSLVQGL